MSIPRSSTDEFVEATGKKKRSPPTLREAMKGHDGREDLPADIAADLGTILARGYLRYRRSRLASQGATAGEIPLAMSPNQSVHPRVVNATEEGEK